MWLVGASIAIALVLAVLVGICLAIARKHGLPAATVAGKLFRHGVLTLVRLAVKVYDPTSPRHAELGPGSGPSDGEVEGYLRIEDLLRRPEVAGRLRVGRVRHEGIRRSRFRFGYQPHDEPRLRELRRRYGLDEVVAGAATDFEALTRLRDWSRSRFRRRDYQPAMTDFDALTVLDRDLRNDEGRPYDPSRDIDPCQLFPQMFVQLALSLGYQARLVQISHDGYDFHGMAEVWSDHFKKWISMDGELALHYQRDGVPLNLLEVHNERYHDGPPRLEIVRGDQTSGDPSTTLVYLGLEQLDPAWVVSYHSYFCIVDLRNDWMTNHDFRAHPRRSDAASLCWHDPGMPPVFDLRPRTSEVSDFYWTLNQTEILARETSLPSRISLRLRTVTPNFERFEIVVDGERRMERSEPDLDWHLHPGRNRLEVRSINAFGHRGIPSSIEVWEGL